MKTIQFICLLFVVFTSVQSLHAQAGSWPANANYVYFGSNSLDQSLSGNYALLQHSAGRTYLNSPVDIRFRIGNAEKMILTNEGNMGIGTTTPDNLFHVVRGSAGEVEANGNSISVFEKDGSGYLSILTPDNSERGILFGQPSSAAAGGIIYNSGRAANGLDFRTNGNVTRMVLTDDGSLNIGNQNGANGYRLAVNGKIIAEEIRLQLTQAWPDYVFQKEYELAPLDEVEAHIQQYGHLKGIPSAKVVEDKGIAVAEIQRTLVEKVEELTLYAIEQQKKIDQLISITKAQQVQMEALRKEQ